ncbi:MAG TPA: hypothetical protein VJX28_04260, partial [Chthoniobacterales bacterium]|nr:hypothetical protein [Chthoniobacterales bacterium]
FPDAFGDLPAVQFVDYDQDTRLVGIVINSQRIASYAKRFAIVGKMLNLPPDIDADTVRRAVIR